MAGELFVSWLQVETVKISVCLKTLSHVLNKYTMFSDMKDDFDNYKWPTESSAHSQVHQHK